MPEQKIASFVLMPNGDYALTPIPDTPDAPEFRVVLEGEMRFAHTGESFDAVYKTASDGAFTERHDFLRWTVPVELESADTARHRYVFRVPAGQNLAGQSLGVRVDVDTFVNRYLISPSEVRNALSGDLRVQVSQTVPPFPWPMVGAAAVPAALVMGGIGVIIRRRMLLQGLSPDLQQHLGSIEQKFRVARSAMSKKQTTVSVLPDRLQAVKDGSAKLIHRIQYLRNTQRLVDRPSLETQIVQLERQMTTLTDTGAKQEAETALKERKKALALLEDLKQTERRAELRLTKIAAVLDTTCLTLRSLPAQENSVPAEETLREELEAQVAAIQEVAREVESFETQQFQSVSLR